MLPFSCSTELYSRSLSQADSPSVSSLQQLRPLAEQGRGEHHGVRAGEQQLDHVVARLDAARRGEADGDTAAEDRDPAQRQPQLLVARELELGLHRHRLEVDVRLQEAVEEDEAGRAGLGEARRGVREGGVVRPDLDGERDA